MENAILVTVSLEVSTRNGYKWVDGYQIITPEGAKLYPYMRKTEAKKYCQQEGWSFTVRG